MQISSQYWSPSIESNDINLQHKKLELIVLSFFVLSTKVSKHLAFLYVVISTKLIKNSKSFLKYS